MCGTNRNQSCQIQKIFCKSFCEQGCQQFTELLLMLTLDRIGYHEIPFSIAFWLNFWVPEMFNDGKSAGWVGLRNLL